MRTEQALRELAELQLPLAAMYGIGDELAALADALRPDEHVIRLATADDGHSFGVLMLTDARVLWVPSGHPGVEVVVWPRERVHVIAEGGVVRVEADDEQWRLDRILPADAADEFVDQLSNSSSGDAAVMLA